ncbi:MAG: branched-chain amino acid ABC transporter permease [Egibacteraceae bacterium]
MAATATGIHHRSYAEALALRHTRAEYARLALLGVGLVVAPFVLPSVWLTVACQAGIAAIGAIGLNILTGYTGQISLGQGGFLAVGAYTSAIVVMRMGLSTGLGIVAGITMTALIGALFGLPALRLKGLYLAIATLASQEIILWGVRNWRPVTGGVDSLQVDPPVVAGLTLDGDFRWYWVILACAILATLAATNLFRTGLGRAFVAIRDQDIAAQATGVDLVRYKLLAFAVSSGFVGLAGALTAHYTGSLTWERFTFDVSVVYVAMIIVGGLGSVAGSIYGALFMVALPAGIQQIGTALREDVPTLAMKLPALQLGAFGLVIILFLIFEPRGLARLWQRMKDYVRLWPFRC